MLMIIPMASSEVLHEYLNKGDSTQIKVYDSQWIAQGFRPGIYGDSIFSISNVSIKGWRDGIGGVLYMNLTLTNSSGAPLVPIKTIANASYNYSTITTSSVGQWINLSFDNIDVNSSTNYSLLLYSDIGSGNSFRWRLNFTSQSYPITPHISINDGVDWYIPVGGTVNGFLFEIWGTQNILDITLTSPDDGKSLTKSGDYFNATYKINNYQYNITNVTYNIWYSNSSLYNQTTIALNGITNSTSILFSNISNGNYIWNVFGCMSNNTNTICNFAPLNRTFSVLSYSIDSQYFKNTVVETSKSEFIMNITTTDIVNLQSVDLLYNGTNYAATKTNLGSNQWMIYRRLNIPVLPLGIRSENRTFSWNVTVSNINTGNTFSDQTDYDSQNVTELAFNLCGLRGFNESVVNFTMFDEITGAQINAVTNATTFQATFNIGIESDNLAKNISINNQSVAVSEFDFCTDDSSNVFYGDMQSEFSAVDYNDNSYFLSNATFKGNDTSEISLYLLPDTSAVEFFITIQEDFSNLPDAIVQVAKYFVGEGVYKTVGIHETDATGKFTANLDLNAAYRYTVIKDGVVLEIIERDAVCEAAPCELTLSISSDIVNPLSEFYRSFGQNVLYNLSYDPLSKMVTFDFIDVTGLATYFRMDIVDSDYIDGEKIINSQLLYTSSGQITYNATNLTDGSYRVEVYVSRSPQIIIDFLDFIISEFIGTFGTLGLIYAVLIIFTIIFGLSLNPTFLIMAIPLSLSLVKLMGFLAIGNTALTIVYALAIMSIIAMNK